jgi:hypothetical protein
VEKIIQLNQGTAVCFAFEDCRCQINIIFILCAGPPLQRLLNILIFLEKRMALKILFLAIKKQNDIVQSQIEVKIYLFTPILTYRHKHLYILKVQITCVTLCYIMAL